jgi:hypothetical protein
MLPSLYSVSEVLRSHGAEAHIITFSSPASRAMPLHDGVHVHDCGVISGGIAQRRAARRAFRQRLDEWMRAHRPRAILAACPFGYLEALRVRPKGVPVVFLFYEMYDANLREFKKSPATALRNWRALRTLEKADLLCTPSPERAGWLVGRTRIGRLPAVVLNSPSSALSRTPHDPIALNRLLPPAVRERRLVVHTGGMSPSRAVMELVASVEHWRSEAALVMTNIDDSNYGRQVRRLAESSLRRERIVTLPLLPREDMLGLQRAGAVGINLMQSDDNLDIMFPAPNKAAEYVHAGLLVVASRSAFTERLADRNLAILAESLEPCEVARAIDEALTRVATSDTRGHALSAAREWYCMDVQLKPVLRAIGYA